ncbi:MAG: tryptophan--tRNA ligase [Candidatus Woesearchaeota archaeon]|jgi:tryptophanyl-tRNA synthetase|nr:tryptophan--tRNA ligase [Candidatus Woesearchaeota archaeon]
MSEQKVTPWDVDGKVDYDKLIKEFGVKCLSDKIKNEIKELSEKKGIPYHIYLKRELFFSHREFDKALEAHKEGKPFFLYTGRSPGGSMHIAHLIPFMFTKYLQDIFDCNLYIQIPDDEKFLFKKDLTLEKVEEMTKSDLLDISAIGFNPDKTFIFRNTEYMSRMYPLYLRTAKKITFSQARNTFGFQNDSNIGMINYPALQIVPTFFEKGICVIPMGIDQDPFFRLQRDIAKGLGYEKNVNIHSKFLSSLTGPEGKMSASNADKAILLTDVPLVVKKKVNKYAFSGGRATLEEHREKGGDTLVDVSYQWLYYLLEEDDSEIARIKEEYESGRMLSGEIKSILIEKINSYIEVHNKNKEKALKNKLLDKYMYTGKLAKSMWNKNF